MKVDADAPLVAGQDAYIAAPVERVWALLTDIDRWPDWQPDVSSAALAGPLAVGARFRWKAKGLAITSTIGELEADRRIGWTGDSLGMRAIHIWTFVPQDGGTRVTTEESLSGWLARLLKLLAPTFLDRSLTASLLTLKARAERGEPASATLRAVAWRHAATGRDSPA